jgi:hypothetical protein
LDQRNIYLYNLQIPYGCTGPYYLSKKYYATPYRVSMVLYLISAP